MTVKIGDEIEFRGVSDAWVRGTVVEIDVRDFAVDTSSGCRHTVWKAHRSEWRHVKKEQPVLDLTKPLKFRDEGDGDRKLGPVLQVDDDGFWAAYYHKFSGVWCTARWPLDGIHPHGQNYFDITNVPETKRVWVAWPMNCEVVATETHNRQPFDKAGCWVTLTEGEFDDA